MKKDLHSLNGLKAFEAAARLGSLTKAADELFVTHGAVSRQISQLEERMAIRLFDRQNKRLNLTDDGQKLFKACSYAFDVLRHTLHELQQTKINTLTVSCEPTIAMYWLIPRLSDFQQQHPEINIQISAAGGPVDFVGKKIDMAIRRNDFPIDHLLYQEILADEWIAPICHPDIYHEDKSKTYCKLHTKTRPNAWTSWINRQRGGIIPLQFSQELWFEHFYLSLQAATSKLGFAIASIYMVGDEIKNKSLLAPLPFVKDQTQYVLIAPSPIDLDGSKQLFRDWLIEQFNIFQKNHRLE